MNTCSCDKWSASTRFGFVEPLNFDDGASLSCITIHTCYNLCSLSVSGLDSSAPCSQLTACNKDNA
uniref:Uncharacterized protein n=1 Tax=Setaria italica TaxID=4555 RepID=K3ZGS5_SETIT